MKKSQIIIGHQYEVQAGRNKTKVKIVSFNPDKQSWQCETPNGKIINIKDVARFLKEVGTKDKSLREIIESKGIKVIPKGRRATSSMRDLDDPTFTRKHHVENGVLVLEDEQPKHRGPKPLGAMSAMSAAHKVLLEEGRPMQIREIMNEALSRGYCVLNGRTIFNTFNGGIRKEISTKGEQSRFVRVDKGLFSAR